MSTSADRHQSEELGQDSFALKVQGTSGHECPGKRVLLPGMARNASAIPTHCQAQHLGKLQKARMAGELTLSETQRVHIHTSGSVLSSSKI